MKNILIEKKQDIILIKINRPTVLNSLNFEVVSELLDIINSINQDDNISGVILTGVGQKAFCAGGDLKRVIEMNPIQAEKYAIHVHNLLNKIENLDKPVIAAINGYALGGGCQLALACDIRIASINAIIGQTEVKIGIPPGWGGTQRLSRVVGVAKAKELIYTGKIISAKEALDIGLVNKIVSIENIDSKLEMPKGNKSTSKDQDNYILLNEKLIEECILLLKEITKNNLLAVKISKSLINKARDVDIDSGLLLEKFGCVFCFTNDDRHKIRRLLETNRI